MDTVQKNTDNNVLGTVLNTDCATGTETARKVLRFADLFAGLGGFRIGVEQACDALSIPYECVFSSEKKTSARKAYQENFGEIPSGDITKINEKDIPDIDMLLSGFPCQPFSQAGMRRGFSDTRGTLFFDIERILKEKRPEFVLLENVEGLIRHDSGNTLDVIVKHLESLGYSVSYRVLDASHYGIPQTRKRLYIVGIHNRNAFDFDELKEEQEIATFKDIAETGEPTIQTEYTKRLLKAFTREQLYGKAITDKRAGDNAIHSWQFDAYGTTTVKQKEILEFLLANMRKRKYARELGIAWRDGMPLNLSQIEIGMNQTGLQSDLDKLVDMGYLLKRHPYEDGTLKERIDLPIGYKLITSRTAFEINRILDNDAATITITATDMSHLGVIDGDGIRRITKREALRLLGFPESYTLDSVTMKETYDLCGNSICVPVVKKIAQQMLNDNNWA